MRSNSGVLAGSRPPMDAGRNGRQVAEICLPLASGEDAWGVVSIPLAILRNGDGPTVLLVGGVHGDEYEGPIVLAELIRTLDVSRLSGTLIVVPVLNPPAMKAGQRCSPLDGLDLARSFPGDPGGTLTHRIAHFAATELIPRADYVLDMHSGGNSIDILPLAILRATGDAELDSRSESAMRSFGAPLAMRAAPGVGRSLVAAAVEQGKVCFAVELGGGGTVSSFGIEAARSGIAGLLAHAEVLDGEARLHTGSLWQMPGTDKMLYAPIGGVLEPRHELGACVGADSQAGQIHHPERPQVPSEAMRFPVSGLLFAQRAKGRVTRDGFVAAVATLAPV